MNDLETTSAPEVAAEPRIKHGLLRMDKKERSPAEKAAHEVHKREKRLCRQVAPLCGQGGREENEGLVDGQAQGRRGTMGL